MSVSEEYKVELIKFQKEMSDVKKFLPKNWASIIMKKKRLNGVTWKKTYDMLVNFANGRSYRSAKKHPGLVKDIKDLSLKYKSLNE